MEPPSPDKTLLKNRCVLNDMPAVLGKLTLAVAKQNTSRIDRFDINVSSVVSNFPTPNNSPEEMSMKQQEPGTKLIPSSENNEDLLTELDGCNSNKSSVILPSTTRKRLLFEHPENSNTSASDLKKLCVSPISQVQTESNATFHDVCNDPTLSKDELEKDNYISQNSLKYLDKHLYYLVNNIYKSMPKFSTKTSPGSFCKASKHILAFKSFVIDHGRQLAEENNWEIILDYVFMAWKHVNSIPKWDNPTHNTARRQCFTSLLRLCTMAIEHMKGTFNKQQQKHYIDELKLMTSCTDEVQKCMELLNIDSTTQ